MARSSARRRPGRPARLSRAGILDAALALLEREPQEPLTVTRIATEVDAVPAALYRHFESLDGLLDGVLAHVLGSIELEIRPRAPWQGQLRDWMTSMRRHLLRYPAVLPLLGRRGRTSPAWLEVASVLIGILERAGLGGGDLARSYLWILETTCGIAMQEASMPLPEQIDSARAALAEMHPEARARMAKLGSHLTRLDGDAFFGFAVERAVEAVARLGRDGESRRRNDPPHRNR